MPNKKARKRSSRSSRKKSLIPLLGQKGALRLGQRLNFYNPRILATIAGVLIIGVAVIAFSEAASATPEIESGLVSKCLDNYQNRTTNGNHVNIYTCNGSGAQQWVRKPNGTIVLDGKCLDVYRQQTANGSRIDLYTCNGGKNQQWRYTARDQLVSVQSGKCLDITGGRTVNNTPVQLWNCNGRINQVWHFTHYAHPQATPTPSPVPPTSTPTQTPPTNTPVPTTTTTPTPTHSASPSPSPTPGPVSSAGPLGIPGNWSLKFDDEFSGTALDTSKWAPYWFSNGSTQNGTKMETSNVSVSGGNLNLTVANNTGGIVSTNPTAGGHYQFTYGAIEARIYLPASGNQIANWPAWWTDGQNWPTDGEIDVIEGLHGQACYHFPPANNQGGCPAGTYTGWHTFGALWEPGIVTYYYDGQKVGTISSGITSAPMYLILENSIGSSSGPIVMPATMQVDYVRVWQ